MFLLDALVLGLLGTLAGATGGLGVCLALNAAELAVPMAVQVFIMSERLHLVVDPGSVLGAITFITLCTTLISLVLSFLAARMRPVTAMHHLG